jgi:hypothetical protein
MMNNRVTDDTDVRNTEETNETKMADSGERGRTTGNNV